MLLNPDRVVCIHDFCSAIGFTLMSWSWSYYLLLITDGSHEKLFLIAIVLDEIKGSNSSDYTQVYLKYGWVGVLVHNPCLYPSIVNFCFFQILDFAVHWRVQILSCTHNKLKIGTLYNIRMWSKMLPCIDRNFKKAILVSNSQLKPFVYIQKKNFQINAE